MERSSRTHGHQAPESRQNINAVSNSRLTRRVWIGLVGGGVATVATLLAVSRFGRTQRDSRIPVTMYASSACQCCHLWVAHLEQNGFRVQTQFVTDVAEKKNQLRVPGALWSCHTAETDGYLVEGHVPAEIIKRFLAERPRARGLAAPGMPGGSPGMESAQKEAFDIIEFTADGTTRVYARA